MSRKDRADAKKRKIQLATPAEVSQFANPAQPVDPSSPNHYRRSVHTHDDFQTYCKQLNEAYLRDLEVCVKRVTDKLGVEESKRRLSMIKFDHNDDNDPVILETRLILDYVPSAIGKPQGTMLGIMFAYVDPLTNKVRNRIDWSPDAASMGFTKREFLSDIPSDLKKDPLAP